MTRMLRTVLVMASLTLSVPALAINGGGPSGGGGGGHGLGAGNGGGGRGFGQANGGHRGGQFRIHSFGRGYGNQRGSGNDRCLGRRSPYLDPYRC